MNFSSFCAKFKSGSNFIRSTSIKGKRKKDPVFFGNDLKLEVRIKYAVTTGL